MAAKLAQLTRRQAEIDSLLSDPGVTGNLDNYRKLTREHAELAPVVALYARFTAREADAASAQEMLADPELKSFGEDELREAKSDLAALDKDLERALLPRDPNDDKNFFSKSEPAPAAMSRPCLPATCFACTRASPSAIAGRSN